jgi:hypothetical protein
MNRQGEGVSTQSEHSRSIVIKRRKNSQDESYMKSDHDSVKLQEITSAPKSVKGGTGTMLAKEEIP